MSTVHRAIVLHNHRKTSSSPSGDWEECDAVHLGWRSPLGNLARDLDRTGVKEVLVVTNDRDDDAVRTPAVHREASSPFSVQVHTVWEGGLRGTAGSLAALREQIGTSPFLVVLGHLWVDLDLTRLEAIHVARGATVTAVVRDPSGDVSPPESAVALMVEEGDSGRVVAVTPAAPSAASDGALVPAGIYLCEARILDFIPGQQHQDFEEQLLGRLIDRGEPVFALRCAGASHPLQSAADFLHLHRQLLTNGAIHERSAEAGKHEVSDRVWTGDRVRVSPEAELRGPVLLDDGTLVEDGARILGPVAIGRQCIVEAGAVIRDSILGDGIRIGAGAEVRSSVLHDGQTVPTGDRVHDSLLGPLPPRAGAGGRRHGASWSCRRVMKRALDLSVALVAILVLLPLVPLMALAIKLDSPGPVFFRQVRTGRGGRSFTMFKFRSMLPGAHAVQQQLRGESRNQVHGPMFKLTSDPRVTRLGRFLRRSCLDELPQLWNVLRGEMSLVGPRPLAEEEIRFARRWREMRTQVRPGLTGLWQVHGRQSFAAQDWIKYDILYVQEWSLSQDLLILAKTIPAILAARRKAHRPGPVARPSVPTGGS